MFGFSGGKPPVCLAQVGSKAGTKFGKWWIRDWNSEFQVVYIVLFAFEATTNRLGATSAGGD
jgi:hypothetical protein